MARINYNNGYYDGDVNYSGKEHGYGTFVWNSGDKYIGYFSDGKFSGQGSYYYANGNRYVGSWSNDLKNGKGTFYFSDGYSYSGDWVNDTRHGFGKETSKWGYYEGEWKNNEWCGKGKEVHNDGVTFEGTWSSCGNSPNIARYENGKVTYGKIVNREFIADLIEGYSRHEYGNGYYEGCFVNGKRGGFGTYYWNSGAVYRGEWNNDSKDGYGEVTIDDFSYAGGWKNDQRYGYGRETNITGDIIDGFWHDSKNAVYATLTQNGERISGKVVNGYFVSESFYDLKKDTFDNGYYEGNYKNGKRNGFGIYHWNSGSRYEGSWVDDSRTGIGEYFWPDGSRYVGEWHGSKMTGYGTYYYPTGTVFKGKWLNDEKVLGRQVYSWGYYEGEWGNQTWCGKGREVITNGEIYEGIWKDSKNATNVIQIKTTGERISGVIVNGTFEAK